MGRFAQMMILIAILMIALIYIKRKQGNTIYFATARGITVRSSVKLNSQLYEVYFKSSEVRGMQTVRILLPRDYTTSDNNRHYPVLYLLHGAWSNASGWTTYGAAQNISGDASLIIVMPNGDPYGYYTNWVSPGENAPQNWRTCHMEQLVPWIDYNLRTVGKKQGRAIAGYSMGGFGAIRYAQQYPHKFIYAASFSGVLDLLDKRLQQRFFNLSINEEPRLGPFGDPSAPLKSNGWFAQDPITHAASLRDVNIALYTGNNGNPELRIRNATYRLRDALKSLNISLYFNDYGNGKSIGYGCNGGHNWPCWRASLIDVLPRMMAVLKTKH